MMLSLRFESRKTQRPRDRHVMVVSAWSKQNGVIELHQSELCIAGLMLVRFKGTVGYGLFQEQTPPLAKIDRCEGYMQIFKIE